MSAGIIGFIGGGALCGVVCFVVASCLSLGNKHDTAKIYQSGYMAGYYDGRNKKESKYNGTV